jgi:hypothetical protein
MIAAGGGYPSAVSQNAAATKAAWAGAAAI